MNLQHINVKLPIANPDRLRLDSIVPVFHSWIQEQPFAEKLLDVADYSHVHHGPGILLVGLDADYSLDNADGILGLRYNRKAEIAGTNQDRLKQATGAALLALERLEKEPSLGGNLRFNGSDIQVFVNDRLLAPNNEQTRIAVEPDLHALFACLFRSSYSVSYPADPRQLFGVSARSAQPFTPAQLAKNLA